jgi:hypothetical protein
VDGTNVLILDAGLEVTILLFASAGLMLYSLVIESIVESFSFSVGKDETLPEFAQNRAEAKSKESEDAKAKSA